MSRTHIGRHLDSTVSSKNQLRNTARNVFEKTLTKERDKTLAGSILGGSGLKICPNQVPIELLNRFISCTFFKLFAMTGSWDLRFTSERREGLKMWPGGHKIHPGGDKNGPCRSQSPAKQQPAQAPRSKEHKESCISP